MVHKQTQRDRLLQFLKYLRMGRNEFETTIGVGIGSVTRAKDTRLSSLLIDRTLTTYPNLNLIWLLFGTGDMILPNGLTNEMIKISGNANVPDTIYSENKTLKEQLSQLQERVQYLEDVNASLRIQAKELIAATKRKKGRYKDAPQN